MFNFGTPTTTSGGTSGGSFMLGNATTATPVPVPTFGSAAAAPAPVFSFGNLAAPRSTLAPTTTTTASSIMPSMAAPTFGSLTGPAGGFSSLAAPAATSTTTASSLFGSTAAAPAAATGFSFTAGPTLGGGFATPSTTSGGIQFGLPTATSAPTPNFSAPAATTSASTFSLGGTSAQTAFTSTVGFNLGQATTQPAASTTPRLPTATATGFSLPVASTAASTAAPTLGGFTGGTGFMTTAATSSATTAAATAPTFSLTTSAPSSSTITSTFLAPSSSTSTSSAGVGGSTSLSLAPVTSTSASGTESQQAAASKPMTYSQLEEHINKWTLELEEQEKIFLNQATQVNAWDRMLLESGDKITALNGTIENLKMEQTRLELEVDYIMSQERELEEAIEPLEKAVESMTVTDSDRQQIYELLSTLDSQTTQMAEQLKETIDHLNELNRAQDENNPVIQISRILNAHMNSLQWLEQTGITTQNQLEETSKMIEMMKKDAEHPYTVSGYYH